jgi:hypothetical protein
VTPNIGPSAGGGPASISGFNLGGATAVYFGTTRAVILSDTPTMIQVTAPAHAAGTVDVTVVTPAGTSPTSPGDQFTYQSGTGNPGPVILNVSPATGPTTGGIPAMIFGSNLGDATAVYYGTTPAVIVSANATTLQVRLPPHPAGTVDVTVVTPEGTSPISPVDRFTYTDPGLPPSHLFVLKPRVAQPPRGGSSSAPARNPVLAQAVSADLYFVYWNRMRPRRV